MIERICFGYSTPVAELEDLKQEALLNIWLSLPKLRNECSLRSWIYRITFNSCITALCKGYRRISTVQLTDLHDRIDHTEDNKDLLSELHEFMLQLNPVDKSVIILWLDDVSYGDIAQITGLTRNNVAVRIHRIKDKIRTKINR